MAYLQNYMKTLFSEAILHAETGSKKNFDFGHFWAITGQKTDRTLFSAKTQAKIV